MVDPWDIEQALGSVIGEISDENYEQSFAHYRFWFNLGQIYPLIPADQGLGYSSTTSDQIFNAIWSKGKATSTDPGCDKLVHPTAHLIPRFARDIESDDLFAPHNAGLQSRLCSEALRGFFRDNVKVIRYEGQNIGSTVPQGFRVHTNLVAHCANLGLVEEDAIRNRILQSLISHQKLYDHQADALVVLFKLAGATFETYAGPSVVNHCFRLLRDHSCRSLVKSDLIQEVIGLRGCGWEGLPPPPVLVAGKSKPIGKGQRDPSVTPVTTSLGLPKGDLKPHIPQPPPFESVIASETDTVPVSPVTQSPFTNISTLSDFTITDHSYDEPPIDFTTITPHETFHIEDGNVEVLCGNTLFRVHTSILSFHSPALRQMFAQTSLTSAESPNGCPRIRSPDTATDFATLLKTIYLPGFPERNKVPDFATFSSLLRITARYELPTVRSQLIEVVRDAYPESFEALTPSRPLGENIFSGPTPHPNAVLNLFVQQNLTSALPMAYYMAARRGIDSLMDRRLPQSATLSAEILRSAISGLMRLREMERDETRRLIFGPKESQPCSVRNCSSHAPTDALAMQAYQKAFDHIVGSSQLGTKVLQVPEFYEDYGSGPQCVSPGICGGCVERWESGHADLRKKAWTKLPDVFELNY